MYLGGLFLYSVLSVGFRMGMCQKRIALLPVGYATLALRHMGVYLAPW